MDQGLIHEDALTVNGRSLGDNCRGRRHPRTDMRHPAVRCAG
ncbi:MAG: hypothetical protein WDN06_07760 [Asticcacaulis sp.]